jgi:hypothetical protein
MAWHGGTAFVRKGRPEGLLARRELLDTSRAAADRLGTRVSSAAVLPAAVMRSALDSLRCRQLHCSCTAGAGGADGGGLCHVPADAHRPPRGARARSRCPRRRRNRRVAAQMWAAVVFSRQAFDGRGEYWQTAPIPARITAVRRLLPEMNVPSAPPTPEAPSHDRRARWHEPQWRALRHGASVARLVTALRGWSRTVGPLLGRALLGQVSMRHGVWLARVGTAVSDRRSWERSGAERLALERTHEPLNSDSLAVPACLIRAPRIIAIVVWLGYRYSQ